VSSGGPDLFVICKSCGSEVSPYITECPYCGSRLRKRAPKLDREGRLSERERRRVRRLKPPTPSLGPLRRGEMPGVRSDGRPYATIALVLASIVLLVLVEADVLQLIDITLFGPPDGEWWRVGTAAFAYDGNGHAFVVLFAIALFGWLIERRHGPLAVVLLFLAGGAGGLAAVAATADFPVALGGNGAALALLTAWAIPDLRDRRRGREVDGDLLGVAVIAAVLLLLPLAVSSADPLAGAVGILAGAALGLLLARRRDAAR
jgi:membrane associated rhomboid family serine protease